MLNFFSYLYERRLTKAILQASTLPNHILLIVDESDLLYDSDVGKEKGVEKLRQFVKWCHALKIDIISVYVSVIRNGIDKNLYDKIHKRLLESLSKIFSKEKEKGCVEIYGRYMKDTDFINGKDEGEGRRVSISIGLGGKSEITKAIKNIAERIKKGKLEPEEINDAVIDSELIFKAEPDLIIRSGGTRLADFLIWQSVYSEFYFTDVNWDNFRKIDLLRAIRDFQMRERRFGG